MSFYNNILQYTIKLTVVYVGLYVTRICNDLKHIWRLHPIPSRTHITHKHYRGMYILGEKAGKEFKTRACVWASQAEGN